MLVFCRSGVPCQTGVLSLAERTQRILRLTGTSVRRTRTDLRLADDVYYAAMRKPTIEVPRLASATLAAILAFVFNAARVRLECRVDPLNAPRLPHKGLVLRSERENLSPRSPFLCYAPASLRIAGRALGAPTDASDGTMTLGNGSGFRAQVRSRTDARE